MLSNGGDGHGTCAFHHWQRDFFLVLFTIRNESTHVETARPMMGFGRYERVASISWFDFAHWEFEKAWTCKIGQELDWLIDCIGKKVANFGSWCTVELVFYIATTIGADCSHFPFILRLFASKSIHITRGFFFRCCYCTLFYLVVCHTPFFRFWQPKKSPCMICPFEFLLRRRRSLFICTIFRVSWLEMSKVGVFFLNRPIRKRIGIDEETMMMKRFDGERKEKKKNKKRFFGILHAQPSQLLLHPNNPVLAFSASGDDDLCHPASFPLIRTFQHCSGLPERHLLVSPLLFSCKAFIFFDHGQWELGSSWSFLVQIAYTNWHTDWFFFARFGFLGMGWVFLVSLLGFSWDLFGVERGTVLELELDWLRIRIDQKYYEYFFKYALSHALVLFACVVDCVRLASWTCPMTRFATRWTLDEEFRSTFQSWCWIWCIAWISALFRLLYRACWAHRYKIATYTAAW